MTAPAPANFRALSSRFVTASSKNTGSTRTGSEPTSSRSSCPSKRRANRSTVRPARSSSSNTSSSGRSAPASIRPRSGSSRRAGPADDSRSIASALAGLRLQLAAGEHAAPPGSLPRGAQVMGDRLDQGDSASRSAGGPPRSGPSRELVGPALPSWSAAVTEARRRRSDARPAARIPARARCDRARSGPVIPAGGAVRVRCSRVDQHHLQARPAPTRTVQLVTSRRPGGPRLRCDSCRVAGPSVIQTEPCPRQEQQLGDLGEAAPSTWGTSARLMRNNSLASRSRMRLRVGPFQRASCRRHADESRRMGSAIARRDPSVWMGGDQVCKQDPRDRGREGPIVPRRARWPTTAGGNREASGRRGDLDNPTKRR